jgi:hypothetical protein
LSLDPRRSSVDWNFLAWAHAQLVVDLHRVERHRPQATLKEGSARPHHDGSSKGELQPVRRLPVDVSVETEEVASHLQNDHWNRKSKANPKPSRHIGELGVAARAFARHQRFQSHAAEGAGSRSNLADFGMHGARVNRASGIASSRCGDFLAERYRFGSARNLSLHPAEQK